MSKSKFLLPLILALAVIPVVAQQANVAAVASMTVGGVGASGPGPFVVTLAAGTANTTVAFSGAANMPFALVNANPGLGGITIIPAAGLPTPFGIVDIAPLAFPPMEFVLDGFSTAGTVLGQLLNTGTTGSKTFAFTLTNPGCPFIAANVQAAVATVAPPGLQLTAAFQVGAPPIPVDAAPVAVSPAAADDSTHPYSVAGGCPGTQSFPFYGVARTGYNINSNGNISLGGSHTTFGETQSGFQAGLAKICPFWDDYNFTGAAGASLTKFDDGVTISVAWTNVPEYNTPGTSNTFTCSIVRATGDIVMTYGAMSSLDGITGITSGANAVATVFGPAAAPAVGRILDHLAGGSLGTYGGVAGETMNELFISPATATAGLNNLASGPTITWLSTGPTSYSMF